MYVGYHFTKCPDITEAIQSELKSFKRSHSSKDIERYWIDSCHRKGLVDGRTGSESSETEVILLKNTADDLLDRGSAGADMNPTNKAECCKLHGQVAEEKKCPSLPDMALFDNPSEVDSLVGIDGMNNVSGSGLFPGGHGSDNTFDFRFNGEDFVEDFGEGTGNHASEGENVTEPKTESKTAGTESELLANTAEDFEPIPISTSPSTQAPFDRAVSNAHILRKVQDACILVEAACGVKSGDLDTGESHRGEFVVLGRHLYQHFSAFLSDDNGPPSAPAPSFHSTVAGTDAVHRTKRGRINSVDGQNITPLSEFGIPYSISNLVQQLCYSGDSPDNHGQLDWQQNQYYGSIKDVLNELQLMIQEPERYLFGEDHPQSGTLNLMEGRLYGREREISELCEAFQDLTTNDSRSILCITGNSGTGKSALAVQLRDPTERAGGFFLSEKFDELQQVKQVPVVFSAFDTLCSEIVRRGETLLHATKGRLESALGSEVSVLMSLIPNLGAINGETDGEIPDLTGQAAFMRLLFCVRQFIKCISNKEHPIVLVIDDLQWADEFSLALIEAIASDDEISSFLLVACYRDREVTKGHPLLRTLRSIEESDTTVRNEIHVDSIDRSSVTALTSDALQIMPSRARPLANLIHSKTGGQPLFVIQFFKSLYDEGLLKYSLSSRRWQWDAEKISEKAVADTVAEIMTGKMLRYPEEVLMSLKLAACLGHEFDVNTLDLLGSDNHGSPSTEHANELTMSDNLEIAVLDGLLIKSLSSASTTYKFSHDQIQLAAYSLISLDEQTALHLQIARLLLSKAGAGGIDSMLFIIVDQFDRGLSLICDRTEKTRVAQLYLRAADKAMSFFAHTAAAMFSAQGISLLNDDHWRTDYRLPLGLCSVNCEANNIGGELDEVEATANAIFDNAQKFEDTLPAYLSLVQAAGSRGSFVKAVNTGLDVLKKLGVVLPHDPDKNTAIMAIDQTRAMLENTRTDITFSRAMQDEKALFAMKMLSLISRYTFMAHRELMAVSMCRMVQLTVEHGVCSNSIIAIGCYAYLLGNSGNLSLGNKYKHLALSLIDQFKAKEAIPQVYVNVYSQMIPIDPAQASFSQLEVAWRTALEYGDREEVFGAMNREIACRFYFGDSLRSIEKSARSHILEMNKKQEKNYSVSTKLFLQVTLNLLDPSCRDPSTLSGEITDQNALMVIALEKNFFSLIMQISRIRIYIAYLFRQYDLAGQLVDDVMLRYAIRYGEMFFVPNASIVQGTFHIGLVSATLCRSRQETDKWSGVTDFCMGRMKAWSEASPWNYGHMMKLLEAERAYCLGDHEGAKAAYKEAIRLAREHKFIHDQALCLERAALYYAETCGNASELSMSYMAESRKFYIKWGALAKAAAM